MELFKNKVIKEIKESKNMLNSCSRNKNSEQDPQISTSGKEGILVVQSGKRTEKVTEREVEAAQQLSEAARGIREALHYMDRASNAEL